MVGMNTVLSWRVKTILTDAEEVPGVVGRTVDGDRTGLLTVARAVLRR
jgi:hypothetical protein